MIILTDQPINVSDLIAKLPKDRAGSVVFHLGVVKAEAGGKKSQGIVFSDRGGLEAEIKDVEIDLRASYKLEGVLLCRRLGALKVGDLIMAVAAAAPDRESAFAACREGVERFKSLKQIQKKELYEEG